MDGSSNIKIEACEGTFIWARYTYIRKFQKNNYKKISFN